MVWNTQNTGVFYTRLFKMSAVLTSVLSSAGCGFSLGGAKDPCQSVNNKVNSEICLSVPQSSRKKIDLAGRLNSKADQDRMSAVISKMDFESITELDLSNNLELTNLPEFVYQLSHLTQLNISKTKISDWKEGICRLKKLKKIVGTHNSYKNGEIPLHTFCIQNLQVLDMSHSNIRYIDEYVGKLKELRELRLRNNQIYIVPLMIQSLPAVSLVDFRNNYMKYDELNTLYDCTPLPAEDVEDCREDMLDEVSCIFYHELPFLRGEPLRKMYTDLIDVDLDEFESTDARPPLKRDRCYTQWVGWMLDFEDPEILKKTIRGKTLRELRYVSPYQTENTSMFCYSIDWPFIENDYEPKKQGALPWEVFPEQFRKPGWATKFTAWYKGDPYYWVPECPHLKGLREHINQKIQWE